MPTLEQDLAAIFSDSNNSTCAEFTLDDGTKVCVDGKFFKASDGATIGGLVEIEAIKATIIVQTSEITAVRDKNAVVIDGDSYQVEKRERSGVGMTTVYLKTKNG